MSPYKIELIEAAPKSQLGEGPHWDAKTQSLYYVDIYPGLLHRYDYKKNQVYTATVEGHLKPISFIIPVKGSTDEFVISIGTSVSVISWNGESAKAKLIRKLDERNVPDVRFNDGKVDTSSRFLFTGTMRLEELGGLYGARLGTFYNYSVKGGFTSFRTNIGISNGLAWNEKTSKFYYIDSIDRNIKEYDYNKVTGDIANERILIDFSAAGDPGWLPDGMTIDSEGFLYVATFKGSKVVRVNPTIGKIDLEIEIPAKQVTSVAFGGPNLDELFVTTSAFVFDEPTTSPAGSLFKITGLGVKGTAMNEFSLL